MLEIKKFVNQAKINEYLRADLAQHYKASDGEFSLAISGGETPLPFYAYMRENPFTQSDKLLKVFWTDERFVPFDDEWSNCYVPITKWFVREKNVKCYPVNTDLDTPKESAQDYALTLTKESNNKLDYVILGMGTDGHTASIFPKHTLSDEPIFSCKHPSDRTERISMNYKVISSASRAILLIKGQRKKSILADASKNLPIHKLISGLDVTCLYID